ncbi:MAG: enoyl-CoA hydratase/isomerase family protein [Erythrobacter sp.]|nr:enoyl-CoA hydratase/isomerase family protein [Erythrobacter sp.]
MTLRLDIEGPVAHLLIDRADKRNAFNMAMWEAMPDLMRQACETEGVRLLVIRAAEKAGAFCAGADIAELLANKDDADWRARNQAAINRVQYQLARLPLPTIAIIDGDCIGGGCGIALACDLRVATSVRVRFGITPAKLGLVYPLHDVKLLVDLVGPGQAKRMLYTGMLIVAVEAQQIGLIEEITEKPDALIEELLAASPHSIRETKQFVRRVLDGQTEDDAETLRIFGEAFTCPDFLEGTTAFVEKRKPEFGK